MCKVTNFCNTKVSAKKYAFESEFFLEDGVAGLKRYCEEKLKG